MCNDIEDVSNFNLFSINTLSPLRFCSSCKNTFAIIKYIINNFLHYINQIPVILLEVMLHENNYVFIAHSVRMVYNVTGSIRSKKVPRKKGSAMKEKLYTIPLNDAVNAQDECPFCFVERAVEQDLMDFVLGSGSSYMEADIREMTDKAGFCRTHFKKMFDFENTLGNAWILKTHYMKIIGEMQQQFKSFTPAKVSFKDKLLKTTQAPNPIGVWITEKQDSCYICNQFKDTYQRYLDTFFYMYTRDEDFRERIKNSKGFCLIHFKDLIEAADVKLSDKDKAAFYDMVMPLMEENMKRVAEDVAWMVEKFDYENKDKPWKNSRDAIQRGMQKLKGGYPAAPAYQQKK